MVRILRIIFYLVSAKLKFFFFSFFFLKNMIQCYSFQMLSDLGPLFDDFIYTSKKIMCILLDIVRNSPPVFFYHPVQAEFGRGLLRRKRKGEIVRTAQEPQPRGLGRGISFLCCCFRICTFTSSYQFCPPNGSTRMSNIIKNCARTSRAALIFRQ